MSETQTYRVLATKTITALFEVDAEDEDDARSQVVDSVGSYSVRCEDALKMTEDDWDVSSVSGP